MQKAETDRIARALQKKGFPASSYDSGSNFGHVILNYDTNTMYFNPWSMPPEWVAVYRKLIGPQLEALSREED